MARTKNSLSILRSGRQTTRRRQQVMLLVLAASLMLAACNTDSSESEGPVVVEIISLDHAPIRSAVEDVISLAAEYGDTVVVAAYSFDSADGEDFASERGITEHLPIAIYVNGASEFTVDGRTVLFESFPQGEGTGVVAEGDWTIDDLRVVLDRETG